MTSGGGGGWGFVRMESFVASLCMLKHLWICSIVWHPFCLREGRRSWIHISSVLLLGGISYSGIHVRHSSSHIPDCWKELPHNCPRPPLSSTQGEVGQKTSKEFFWCGLGDRDSLIRWLQFFQGKFSAHCRCEHASAGVFQLWPLGTDRLHDNLCCCIL